MMNKNETSQTEFDFSKRADLDKKKAIRLKNRGIDRAAKKAEKEIPEWHKKMLHVMEHQFLMNHNGTFMAEEFRSYVALMDYELPENQRSFGGLMKMAEARGIIRQVGTGYTKSKKSHRTTATLWIQVKPSDKK